jgi:hypothetical protein
MLTLFETIFQTKSTFLGPLDHEEEGIMIP